MPTEYDNDLLKEGILCFKSGEFVSARRYFERALDVADDYHTRSGAYYYLSLLTSDPAKKRDYLEEVLAIDPVHAEARRELAILDGRLKREEIIDPDAAPSPAPGTVQARADRFTCPRCGGRMVYAPDGSSLTCEYCNRLQPSTGLIAREQDFFAAMATGKGHNKPVSTQVFHCQGCDAEFLLEAQQISAVCAYCASAHVVRQSRDLAAPDAVLPFGFDAAEAQRLLDDWLQANQAAPSTAPRPLYLPVWTFDLVGRIPWNGLEYHEKRMVRISGEKTVVYNDIPIPGTKKLAALLPAVLEGFNFSVTVPYEPGYLAGWPAEVPGLSLAEAALEARRIAVQRVREAVHLAYRNLMDLRYQSSALAVDMYRLVLVPIWLAEVQLADRSTPLIINGVTGSLHAAGRSRRPLGKLFGRR